MTITKSKRHVKTEVNRKPKAQEDNKIKEKN